MEVKCGGGHRSWDFYVTPSDVTLLFIKDKEVYESCRPRNSVFNMTLDRKYGGHLKSICRARIICSGGQSLVLTASEDTTIRISKLSDGSLQCLTTVPKHISSVRALAVRSLGSTGMWLCLSAGGRAQLSAGLIQVSVSDHQTHVIYQDVRTHYLRGLLTRRSYKPWASVAELQLIPDPETRYMDVDVVGRSDAAFSVFAACSDGLVR